LTLEGLNGLYGEGAYYALWRTGEITMSVKNEDYCALNGAVDQSCAHDLDHCWETWGVGVSFLSFGIARVRVDSIRIEQKDPGEDDPSTELILILPEGWTLADAYHIIDDGSSARIFSLGSDIAEQVVDLTGRADADARTGTAVVEYTSVDYSPDPQGPVSCELLLSGALLLSAEPQYAAVDSDTLGIVMFDPWNGEAAFAAYPELVDGDPTTCATFRQVTIDITNVLLDFIEVYRRTEDNQAVYPDQQIGYRFQTTLQVVTPWTPRESANTDSRAWRWDVSGLKDQYEATALAIGVPDTNTAMWVCEIRIGTLRSNLPNTTSSSSSSAAPSVVVSSSSSPVVVSSSSSPVVASSSSAAVHVSTQHATSSSAVQRSPSSSSSSSTATSSDSSSSSSSSISVTAWIAIGCAVAAVLFGAGVMVARTYGDK
jgi:hypothetical protein